MKGFIYILTNEFMPGIVKIGCTKNNPEIRASDISGSSGVPVSFVVSYSIQVEEYMEKETKIHKKLKEYRINKGREFFKININEAIHVIEEVCNAPEEENIKTKKKRNTVTFQVSDLLLEQIKTIINVNTQKDEDMKLELKPTISSVITMLLQKGLEVYHSKKNKPIIRVGSENVKSPVKMKDLGWPACNKITNIEMNNLNNLPDVEGDDEDAVYIENPRSAELKSIDILPPDKFNDDL